MFFGPVLSVWAVHAAGLVLHHVCKRTALGTRVWEAGVASVYLLPKPALNGDPRVNQQGAPYSYKGPNPEPGTLTSAGFRHLFISALSGVVGLDLPSEGVGVPVEALLCWPAVYTSGICEAFEPVFLPESVSHNFCCCAHLYVFFG